MNCRKTGNQTKNRIYVKHNKREPRGGEGRRMTGIIMLSVSRQWPNPRDRLTMITQRRSVNEFRRNEHKLETMQLPPCSSIYRERMYRKRKREKERIYICFTSKYRAYLVFVLSLELELFLPLLLPLLRFVLGRAAHTFVSQIKHALSMNFNVHNMYIIIT